MRYDGYVITDQKTTNSVKYHHYAIVQLQKNVYLCRLYRPISRILIGNSVNGYIRMA